MRNFCWHRKASTVIVMLGSIPPLCYGAGAGSTTTRENLHKWIQRAVVEAAVMAPHLKTTVSIKLVLKFYA